MYAPQVERKFLKKSIKSDYVKTELDLTLERVNSSVGDIQQVTNGLVQKVDDKLVEVDHALFDINEKVGSAITELQNIEIPQGEKGDKGENGVTPDIQNIVTDVLSRIPQQEKIDESRIVARVLKQIPQNKASLKIIQESIDQDKLIQEITSRLQLKTSNIEGLDLAIKALDAISTEEVIQLSQVIM
jgi:SOS response regulatory protein OraA/RecX